MTWELFGKLTAVVWLSKVAVETVIIIQARVLAKQKAADFFDAMTEHLNKQKEKTNE